MDTISINQFQEVDIRVGTVKKAEIPEWSHAVIKMTVDFGKEIGKKNCFSGIMKFYKGKALASSAYKPEDLEGKQFPFVVNLEPKTIGPDKELSEAMMIMATPRSPQASLMAVEGEKEDETPVLFKLPKKVVNGTKVY